MEILNIGPLELIIFLLVAFLLLGPKDMVLTAYKIGEQIRKLVRSPVWREILRSAQDIRELPTKLMEETGLQEELDSIKRDTQATTNELNASIKEAVKAADVKEAQHVRIDVDPTILPPAALSTTTGAAQKKAGGMPAVFDGPPVPSRTKVKTYEPPVEVDAAAELPAANEPALTEPASQEPVVEEPQAAVEPTVTGIPPAAAPAAFEEAAPVEQEEPVAFQPAVEQPNDLAPAGQVEESAAPQAVEVFESPKPARKRTPRKAAAQELPAAEPAEGEAQAPAVLSTVMEEAPKPARKRTTKKAASEAEAADLPTGAAPGEEPQAEPVKRTRRPRVPKNGTGEPVANEEGHPSE